MKIKKIDSYDKFNTKINYKKYKFYLSMIKRQEDIKKHLLLYKQSNYDNICIELLKYNNINKVIQFSDLGVLKENLQYTRLFYLNIIKKNTKKDNNLIITNTFSIIIL